MTHYRFSFLYKFHPSVIWARFLGFLRRRNYQAHGKRPASGPFVSGDSFRALAQHVWDEREEPSFSPSMVQPFDSIFVSWHVKRFLTELAPRIEVPFFLLTSNSDYAVSESDVAAFKKTEGLHWWAANLLVATDEKITAIPLGFQNERFCWYGDVRDFLRLQTARRPKPLPLICWGFAVENAPEIRGPIRKALRRNPYAVELPNLDPYAYRRELRKYQYVASPPGNGPDVHRTWEALALGVTPLVLETQLIRNLQKQGMLPGVRVMKTIEDFETFLPEQKGSQD